MGKIIGRMSFHDWKQTCNWEVMTTAQKKRMKKSHKILLNSVQRAMNYKSIREKNDYYKDLKRNCL